MNRVKITVQKESDENDEMLGYWEPSSEIVDSDKKVIAAYLRALADSYDPPQKIMRGS